MKTFNEWMGASTRLTKNQAVDMLFSILKACNSADSEQNTDFPPHAASQKSTYGHIVEAIKSLGAGAEYDHWVATGERWRHALEMEVESDFRRKAITREERDDLLKSIQNSDSETEARNVVDSHRRGRA